MMIGVVSNVAARRKNGKHDILAAIAGWAIVAR
jgi:hypothetical protein